MSGSQSPNISDYIDKLNYCQIISDLVANHVVYLKCGFHITMTGYVCYMLGMQLVR